MKNIKGIFICLLILVAGLNPLSSMAQIKLKASATAKCLFVSDIHFAPLYGSTDTGLERKLNTTTFVEWEQIFKGIPKQMSFDSLAYKDANYAVLSTALVNMKEKLPNPAFIVIAGDFIWHNATISDSTLKKKTIQFIAWLFKNKYPGVPIFPTMGNNDTYGNDYDLQDPKFLKDFAEAWQPNLPKAAADTLIAKGYYTADLGNIKLMVINSAPLNFGSNYPTQATAELKWIGATLAAENKKVWILSHIPPGLNGYNSANMWTPAYANQFVNDVVKYSAKVKLSIASHTHFNDFKVYYDTANNPVSLMRIIPSVCSNHGNNPSFEVAEFDINTGELVNETNHYLNLITAPQYKKLADVKWAGTINLLTNFNFKLINATSFSDLINRIKTDTTYKTLSEYVKFYDIGTPLNSINKSNYLNYLNADVLKATPGN